VNCKKAHLACDVSRPCQRCVSADKTDTCHDVQHKKRGRPKMMRDSNNNKVRPTTLPTNYHVMTFPSEVTTVSNDTMTVLLSMDLCCARVTDESLEYLQLYPQEFSHRSIYDFLIPGESCQSMSKLHRCLLDNAVQHQQKKQPPETVRSSYEAFFSSPLSTLLNIANGSLTLKTKLNFRTGGQEKTHEEMNCKLYLGGGLGADLFDTSSLQQLYVVCVLSLNKTASKTSLPLPAPLFNIPPLAVNSTASESPTTTNYSYTEEDDDDGADYFHDDESKDSQSPQEKGPAIATSPPAPVLPEISLLEKFRYTPNRGKQFIHPHELYYLQTTSSRLSSDAIAYTTNFYLSTKGSSALTTYNNSLNK
ncbi:hypothetical protein INT47_010813, partial [Mucor saturninus]